MCRLVRLEGLLQVLAFGGTGHELMYCPLRPLSPARLLLAAAACKFDLRFVPDEQSFEGRQVRDEATDVPSGVRVDSCECWGGWLLAGLAQGAVQSLLEASISLWPGRECLTCELPPLLPACRLCTADVPGAGAAAHQRAGGCEASWWFVDCGKACLASLSVC